MESSSSFIFIDDLIFSDQFCNGNVSIVAYNTAWVARIRKKNKPNEPAFPQSLNWLRKNQLGDGSWGSKYPELIFERIVSTLISVICLKQWSFESDVLRIERGVQYIRNNFKYLLPFEKLQDKMTIGFELILPSLVDEALCLGINLDQETIIQVYREEKKKKLSKIIQCKMAGINFGGIKSWCFTLEGLDNIYSDEEISSMVAKNGLICCSYGATAFALFRGIPLGQSYKHISKVVMENNGGIPSLYKVKIFDLAWSLNSLILAGYNMNKVVLSDYIDELKTIWIGCEGMMGASIGLPPDADDTANTIFALSSCGRLKGIESLNSLMKFFRNNYFITFEAERLPSLSTNINCLIALKNFQEFENIRKITYDVFEWTKSKIIDSGFKFQDKWHLSQLYSMSRALVAFDYIDYEFSEKIFEILVDKQNKDGGWGSCGRSTPLESSYAIISMIYWLKNNRKILDDQAILILKNAKTFLENDKSEQVSLWIDKALYSPVNVDTTSILAAKFALDRINN